MVMFIKHHIYKGLALKVHVEYYIYTKYKVAIVTPSLQKKQQQQHSQKFQDVF